MQAVPQAVSDAAVDILESLDPIRQRTFQLRLQRWWPDLIGGLRTIYADRADELATTVVRLAARAFAERPTDLHELDERRQLQPDWFQLPSMIGYAGYTERFAGSLRGIHDHLDHLTELGVTYLHLMPLLRPREGDSDGGYAVQDYRSVRPDLGTVDDLRALSDELRKHDISLVVDLVLNHVAHEHEWAVRARAGEAAYQDYFYVFDDRELPDAYEKTLPEVFPDFAPGNFTLDPELNKWVWTTFNSFQWDVNWTNPAVFAEYADIILFLANCGVEVLRLDAIAFIVKRMGTDCQNQPEVHSITQALHAMTRIACPAVVFKAEAIVGPSQLVQYLGQGRFTGKVSDLAYHNSLMVQIWSMLATKTVTLTAQALGRLPAKSAAAAWICYSRCHDDIGWAIDDGDAGAVGLSGFAHRSFLSDWYSGEYPMSPAEGLVFQYNPETGDRRISGTAAALVGLPLAMRTENQPLVDAAVSRLLLAHQIIAGWGGIPVIWSGDEFAEPNDPHWADDPSHAADNRWAHRPPIDWSLADQPDTHPAQRVFAGMAEVNRIRKGLPQLHASAESHILPLRGDGVLPVARDHASGRFVGLYNVTEEWRPYPAAEVLSPGCREVLHDTTLAPDSAGLLWVPPLTGWWIVADA